jgi:HlyD family secretion protein
MNRWSVFGIVGILAAGAVTWGVAARSADDQPTVIVRTGDVSTGPVTRHIVASGSIEAVSTVDVGSQISGTVQSLEADYNSIVHKGQVIAHLDPSSYQAQYAKAQASLAQAKADQASSQAALTDAQTKYRRSSELGQKGLVTAIDLADAKAAVGQAQASLRSAQSQVTVAQAALDQAKVNLDYTVIRSPIDGIVVARLVDVGQTVAARLNAPVLFMIAQDFKHLQLELQVDEDEVSDIHKGQSASFTVEAFPGETFQGTVAQVRLQPDQAATTTVSSNGLTEMRQPRVVTYTAVVDISNPAEELRPGMTAIATVAMPQCDSCLRVPNDAVAFRPSEDVLSALDQKPLVQQSDDPQDQVADAAPTDGVPGTVWHYVDGRLQPTDVLIGAQGDQYTEILNGKLDPGQPVVTSARLPTVALPTARSPLAPQPRFRRGGFRGGFGGGGFRGR